MSERPSGEKAGGCGPVASLASSRSGATFATTGGADGLDECDARQLGANLPGPPGRWGTAAFTPDGRRLVVDYADGSGVVWLTDVASWARHACAVAGRSLTREAWRRFVPGRSYTRVCG